MKLSDHLEKIIVYLTESHLDAIGGYPYDAQWIGDTFVVAELDPSKDYVRTMITTYEKHELTAWAERAAEYAKEYDLKPEKTMTGLETWPDECFAETAE